MWDHLESWGILPPASAALGAGFMTLKKLDEPFLS